MTSADFVAELYREYDWRFNEVRWLKNLIEREQPSAREVLRKSLVVVLYAHFEGFCVFALQHYLAAVNALRMPCQEVTSALIAGAWERVFNAMEHGDQKNKIFRQTLPNDVRLHRHWRRRHFVESIQEFYKLPVEISEHVIDAESNLKPEILERNLFIIGLDHTFVEPHFDTIHNLLGRRNRLAHGEDRRGVSERDYEEFESSVFNICYLLIQHLEDAHKNAKYKQVAPSH
jgi:MAE_28990/MAE_18760-like HEPN